MIFPNPRDVGSPPLTVVSGTPFVPNATDNNFAMRATGFIYIPTAGTWSFAVKSDDGCRLKMGATGVVVTEFDGGRGPSYSNSLGGSPGSPGVVDSVANVPSPGFYRFELVWNQGGGGAMMHFSATAGSAITTSNYFNVVPGMILVGDTTDGGLAMYESIHPGTGSVAATGDQVTGENPGTRYKTFGVPSLDAFSTGFLASIQPQALPSYQAIIFGINARIVLREGDEAPGVTGAVFRKFKDPVFANGHYAFVGAMGTGFAGVTSANSTGIWSSASGSLALVARLGDPAPGITGATFKSFNSMALPPAGKCVFVAKLAGVPSSQSLSLWRETTTGPVLILQQGTPLALGAKPATNVAAFAVLPTVPNSPDQSRFGSDGSIPIRIVFADHTQAVASIPPNGGALVPIALMGDSPDLPASNKFKTFGLPSETSSADFGFLSTLQTRVGDAVSSNANGIFADLSLDVRQSDDAPGTTASGPLDKFLSFKDPAFAKGGTLAFLAKLAPSADVTKTSNMGIWSQAAGELELIARTSGAVPGVPGAQFLSFTSLSLPDGAKGPAFVAKLVIGPGGVDKTSNSGLWATDSTGTAFLVVRTGDMVQVGETSKKVTIITALGAVATTPAQARGTNALGELIYRFTFSDHTQAIYRFEIP